MSLAPRLVGILSITFIAMLLGTIYLNDSSDRAVSDAQNKAAEAHRATRLALTAQVHFKKQVQEWKNILLRGFEDKDFTKYQRQFYHEAEIVQQTMAELLHMLPEGTRARESAIEFQRAHRRLASQYEQGLFLFARDRNNPFRVDASVRGIDRQPTDLLDDVVDGVKSWRESRLGAIRAQLEVAREGSYAVIFTVLLVTLAFVAWVIRSWVYQPVQQGIELAERVSRGDHSPLQVRGAPGEIGRLLEALQQMQASLRAMKAESEASLEAAELARRSAEDARSRAEADERAKAQFLRNVSHELNTPLHHIMSSLDDLLEAGLNQTLREAVGTAMRSSRQLVALVTQILRFVELDDGRTELRLEREEPRVLMDRLHLNHVDAARSRGLELSFEVDKDVPAVMIGDWPRLQEVIGELVGNALQFTDQGFVHVRMSRSHRFEPGLRVEIKDSGRGVPEDQRERIFSRFTQVDESNTREQGGLGTGLAMCREFLRIMNGTVELMDTSEQGSTFVLDVPLDVVEEDAAA